MNFIIEDGYLRFVGEPPTSLDEAWDITIEKWNILAEGAVSPYFNGGHTSTCGLCMLFIKKDCEGCPIRDDGHQWCSGTPYSHIRHDRKNAMQHTNQMLDYLINLRERSAGNTE